MAHNADTVEVHLGAQGRVVIPAAIRKKLGVDEGDTLLAHIEEDRIILEKVESVKLRFKSRFSRLNGKTSLADELTSVT